MEEEHEANFTDTDELACAGIVVIEEQYERGLMVIKPKQLSPQTDSNQLVYVPPKLPPMQLPVRIRQQAADIEAHDK